MTNFTLHSTSGPDGKLHLEIPVGRAGTEYEVNLTARPTTTAHTFPPGYFDLIGSVDDDTLTVHPDDSRGTRGRESFNSTPVPFVLTQ